MSRGLITFSSSHTAMEAELLCEDSSLQVRLIPLPVSIHAGCGLALLHPMEVQLRLLALLASQNISYENVYREEGTGWYLMPGSEQTT